MASAEALSAVKLLPFRIVTLPVWLRAECEQRKATSVPVVLISLLSTRANAPEPVMFIATFSSRSLLVSSKLKACELLTPNTSMPLPVDASRFKSLIVTFIAVVAALV